MSQLRQARERGRERGQDRGRERGRGRGAHMQYYEDMGMSSTEQGHEEFTEYKKKQETAISNERERISRARGEVGKAEKSLGQSRNQLNQAKSQIQSYHQKIQSAQDQIKQARLASDPRNLPKLTQEAYRSAQKNGTLMKVNVVSGKDNRTEGSYWVPKQDFDALAKSVQYSNFAGGQGYLHVRSNGRFLGKELHDQLRHANNSYQTEIKKQAQRQIAGAMADSKGMIARAQGQVNTANSELKNARSRVDGFQANIIKNQGQVDIAKASLKQQMSQLTDFEGQEKQYLVDLGEKYDKKIAGMRRILGGLSATKGETTTEGGVLAQVQNGPTLTEQVVQGQNVPVAQAEQAQAEMPTIPGEQEAV